MNISKNNSNNLKALSTVELDKINGGNVLKTVGKWIGTGLAYYCKGVSAIKG